MNDCFSDRASLSSTGLLGR